ncbi:MAG: cob(I)yrinic acid a,c-diamide adenosyltransferase [Holophagaceae bacterium]|nr:cob(I)yrinic acid a,c-diamide adenosyltransferase [Holophagaceae bacterium]
MKLYTRTGDEGMTGLFGGDRVNKSHQRLMAYGALDELNSVIGVLRLHASDKAAAGTALEQVQHDLFVLGAILATPSSRLDALGEKMTKPTWEIPDMEQDIDRLTALAPPMKHFVLPGGSAASSHAHLARTVCRRAERDIVALNAEEPVPMDVLVYINRLSDWLFALARAENAVQGVPDVEWIPR